MECFKQLAPRSRNKLPIDQSHGVNSIVSSGFPSWHIIISSFSPQCIPWEHQEGWPGNGDKLKSQILAVSGVSEFMKFIRRTSVPTCWASTSREGKKRKEASHGHAGVCTAQTSSHRPCGPSGRKVVTAHPSSLDRCTSCTCRFPDLAILEKLIFVPRSPSTTSC